MDRGWLEVEMHMDNVYNTHNQPSVNLILEAMSCDAGLQPSSGVCVTGPG